MTIQAVEGGAGCGKTYRLMAMLAERLETHPLNDGQRVLALTFMHGSRRRLSERLRSVANLRGRVECCTIDAFAWRIYRRWRGLAGALAIAPVTEGEFDRVCEAAGMLLEQPQVCAWVAASFPIVLVDEGQDLKPERLRMLRALAGAVHALIAADEFQCLDQALRPNPLVAWLQQDAEPETLVQVRRTNAPGLLAAATAIRAGNAPINGAGFKLLPPGASVPLATTLLANAIAWRQGGDVAVITPALQGGFAKSVVRPARSGAVRQTYTMGLTPSIGKAMTATRRRRSSLVSILPPMRRRRLPAQRCGSCREPDPCVRHCRGSKIRFTPADGTNFTRAEIEAVIARQVSLRRQHGGGASHQLTAMTVQQAKNREFEGVVVIWPYQVGGDAEHKRRLLYNAITRAKRWCNVIVQSQHILDAAPFA